MDLLNHFTRQILTQFPQLAQQRVLLAVSGGADSVVMADLFHKSGIDFVIAHCNFQLRGEESDRDENFVRSLAEQYQKEIFTERFDTNHYAEKNKTSIQVAARELRYEWFEVLRKQLNLSFISTAHHANDNIETMLMHLFRGTGLNGLTGIPASQERIIRPLLPYKKQLLLQYVAANGLNYVEDSSNESVKYTRNFFRNELIPAIAKTFPNVEDNLLHTIHRLNETAEIYNALVQVQKEKLFKRGHKNDLQVAILQLKKLKPLHTWMWELFKEFHCSPAQVSELIKLLDGNNGSYLDTPTHRLIRDRKWLIITERSAENKSDFYSIEPSDKKIVFENCSLSFTHTENNEHLNISKAAAVAMVDASKLHYPLLLRKWKTGDYFYPLGMQKKKKLSRFMIDQKFSKLQKENTWVLETNKKIVWIVGHRIDDRFKITSKTKSVLKIEAGML